MDHIFDRVVYGVKLIILILSFACSSSSSSSISNYNNDYYYYMNSLIGKSKQEHRNFTAISDFRLVNRRILNDCVDLNPYQRISVASNSNLADDQIVTVTVSGVLFPSDDDWVAMISPSHAKVNACPFIGINYAQTGDFTNLPLLCHYPVKSIFLKKDPDYLSCKKKECSKQGKGGKCEVTTCSATVSFHVINIRTDISFVFFGGGFDTPCTLARTSPLPFLNPNMPLHAHLNSIDSTSTSMRVTWVSGDNKPQQVQYGDGKTQTSLVTTFTQKDMCKSDILVSPAKDFGWHDPGFIHSAVMTDSGGECGVPYETYFQMPTLAKDKPWYSIEQGTVHFTVISTEHNWKKNSEQYLWMKKDMASINRAKTPWLIFMGHRPMYTSSTGLFSVDTDFAKEVEPLLLANKVDLVLFGHVHNYERTCSVYKNSCLAMPNKDQNGVDTYDHNNYSAPVHAVIGMAGFSLDKFPNDVKSWSLRRISEFGYLRAHATKQDITLETFLMGLPHHIWGFKIFFINLKIIVIFLVSSSSSSLHPLIAKSKEEHRNFTAISNFRIVNRRFLSDCPDLSPYQKINVSSSNVKLGDEEYVSVTISGVMVPSQNDWVGMISPSHVDVNACPTSIKYYVQTGDIFTDLPLLCHYPVKSIYLTQDPDYLSCKKKECKKYEKQGICEIATCSASVSFHVINIRTDIEFILFGGGFDTPCIQARTAPLTFLNPNMPLYGHISSVDSSATSMRVTWVSGDSKPQKVEYGDGKTQVSEVTTFTQKDMCASPAKDFGWHDPGFIHSAVMTGLQPLTEFTYRYGRDYLELSPVYGTPDSGGECGVPYETYFPMPTPAKDKPWYSIEQGSVHFTVISTEHVWEKDSEQYEWMKNDMASVDRSKTPWLIFTGHRPMYTSSTGLYSFDQNFTNEVEPLLMANKVNLVLFGHVHNYERTCSVYRNECLAMPKKDQSGIDTYDHSNYTAPVHAVIGMAGFSLDQFPIDVSSWSLKRFSEFGYLRAQATKEELKLEVKDSFRIIKKQDSFSRKINMGR
ncbi:hypothetical protein G4B88_024277 [Cannabis sativa]|uniref:Purple acid phosphatase n=1 Tax=Cannabis sativa TaxID=3483 RepID=A0A7J6DPU8_CANSA|nr:hypothetical protein G4B88_024277 [Cannabis sativa]